MAVLFFLLFKSVNKFRYNGQNSSSIARLSDIYTKQSTALKNKIHREETLGNPSPIVIRSLNRSLTHIRKEKKLLEGKLIELVKKEHAAMLTNLEPIPGLGRKTATMLIVYKWLQPF